MASAANPTGCYKCGKTSHWSRDCPSQPASETPAPGASAKATTPSSSGFSKGIAPAGTQARTQGQTQGGTQRWQGSTQGYKRKEPWGGGGSRSFVAKEKPVKAPVPPRRMPKLTPDLILGADGLGYVLEKIPRQVTIKGRGHEVEDLKSLLEAYLRWHQVLLPYFSYSQFVEKVEKVGSSKRVRVC